MLVSSAARAAIEACYEEIDALADASRLLVAVAGPPGSGKSAFGDGLVRRLGQARISATLVPMDGFHLDNEVLAARGLTGRKGAPESFDAGGLVSLVARLRSGEDVFAPRFDRARDLAVAGAIAVPAETRVVVLEGTYLLFDEAPWAELHRAWDLSIRLDVPLAELRARLIQRWLSHGLGPAAAARRVELNDLPNAQRVIDGALPADLVF